MMMFFSNTALNCSLTSWGIRFPSSDIVREELARRANKLTLHLLNLEFQQFLNIIGANPTLIGILCRQCPVCDMLQHFCCFQSPLLLAFRQHSISSPSLKSTIS